MGGGQEEEQAIFLFVWFMNDFCTLPNLVCPVESWPQLDRRLYEVMSWHRTRWRPNPYAREDADFAQQNIRTLLRPFSHQAAAGADQDSHFKGAFFLEKQLPAAGWARPRCSMYREHYRWHSSPLARVFPLVVWLSASSQEVSLKLSPSNELTNFASVLSCFGPLQPSSKSSLDTVAMMHHSMNPLTLQHTFQHSPCLGLKQLRPVIWDVSKGNQVQQTICSPQAFWRFHQTDVMNQDYNNTLKPYTKDSMDINFWGTFVSAIFFSTLNCWSVDPWTELPRKLLVSNDMTVTMP